MNAWHCLRLVFVGLVTLMTLAACGGGGGGSSEPPLGSGGGTGAGGSGSTPGQGTGGGTANPPGATAPIGVELEGGVSGTGLNLGPVQGFSSVIVNGIAMDVSNATLLIEGAAGTQDALRVGQTVAVIGDLGSAEAVDLRYRADLIGPLAGLTVTDPLTGEASATVLGQSLLISSSTFFEGTTVSQLADGQLVSVSGRRRADGVLLVTYLGDAAGSTTYKAVGVARSVAPTSFELDGLTVSYDAGTLQNFGTAGLVEGDRVEASAPAASFAAPASLTAERVERLAELAVLEQADLALDGFIDRFASEDDFDVDGQPVRVNAQTSFLFGSVDDLALNRRVAITGTTDDNEVLIADTVTLRPLEAVRVEGPLVAVDAASATVQALGVTFALRDLTELEDDSASELDPLTLADLAVGDQVELRGFLEGAVPVAVELERLDPDSEASIQAPISDFDATANTVALLGVPLVLDASTRYENADGNDVSAESFFALLRSGLFLEASWDSFVDLATPVTDLAVAEADDD